MIPSVGKAIQCVFNDDLDGLKKLSIEEIKETDEQGRTALHAACFKGYPKLLVYMIENSVMKQRQSVISKIIKVKLLLIMPVEKNGQSN